MIAASECARMNSAREARFRVDYPNSTPRVAKIIALDEQSARALPSLLRSPGAQFLTARRGSARDGILVASDGSEVTLPDVLESADAVVMVAYSGESAEAAAIIGAACLARGIMTTGVILTSRQVEGEASATLKDLRRYAAMLVVTSDEDYLADMLSALRV
jgi:hypothetical protein